MKILTLVSAPNRHAGVWVLQISAIGWRYDRHSAVPGRAWYLLAQQWEPGLPCWLSNHIRECLVPTQRQLTWAAL